MIQFIQSNVLAFINIHKNKEDEIPMAHFFEDSKGRFWMSSYARKGTYLYDGAKFVPFEHPNSDKLVDIKCIAEDKHGHIWFGGRYGLL